MFVRKRPARGEPLFVRRVLIQRRRFVTAEFRRPNPHISLPLYCVRSRHPLVPVTRRCIILFQKVPAPLQVEPAMCFDRGVYARKRNRVSPEIVMFSHFG